MKISSKKLLLILLSVVLSPVVLFAYFALLWFWAGDGVFMLISVPIFFAALLFLQILLYKRIPKQRHGIQILSIYCMILATPILTTLVSYALAWLCGIQLTIT